MHRKRYSLITGEWIDYFSIPGGGIEKGELPERAVARELQEEMGLRLSDIEYIAHCQSNNFEHHVFTAQVPENDIPVLQADSEEAIFYHTEKNQFIPEWVDISKLTPKNLRYYHGYLPLIQRLHKGEIIEEVVEIVS